MGPCGRNVLPLYGDLRLIQHRLLVTSFQLPAPSGRIGFDLRRFGLFPGRNAAVEFVEEV
jgi:hypothetical protein